MPRTRSGVGLCLIGKRLQGTHAISKSHTGIIPDKYSPPPLAALGAKATDGGSKPSPVLRFFRIPSGTEHVCKLDATANVTSQNSFLDCRSKRMDV